MYKGRLILILGPSGVGKGTVTQKLFENKELCLTTTISATTRAKRPGEKNGKEYHFITREKFDDWIKKRMFIEWSEHFSNKYGTLHSEIERIIEMGKNPFAEVETNGALIILEKYKNYREKLLTIFIEPPSFEELAKRIKNRSTETEKQIDQRLKKAQEELNLAGKFDFRVVNHDVNKTADTIERIIKGEI